MTASSPTGKSNVGLKGSEMISRIDHVVLTVRDIEAAVAFYTRVLGWRP